VLEGLVFGCRLNKKQKIFKKVVDKHAFVLLLCGAFVNDLKRSELNRMVAKPPGRLRRSKWQV
jgi:hypothetical protein